MLLLNSKRTYIVKYIIANNLFYFLAKMDRIEMDSFFFNDY
jgi:hypothetical protein